MKEELPKLDLAKMTEAIEGNSHQQWNRINPIG